MKTKRIISVILSISMVSGFGLTALAEDSLPAVGDEINGFIVTDIRDFELLGSDLVTFEHEKTGAQIIYIDSDDINCAFNISFRTPPVDDTGLTHVFEHSALSGSEKYPSRTLAFNLMNQSYITYMNATTSTANTSYMISSLSDEQLYNLADYYLSGVFDTMIYTDPSIKEREAWHYELDSPESELTLSGTVYSEMQGSMNITNSAFINAKRSFYPGSPVSFNSGGEPEHIPELENEDMIEYHSKYYHPSNSLTTLYGDMDYKKYLALFNSYFSEYDRQTVDIDLSISADTPEFIDDTYYFPAAAGTDSSKQSVIYYLFECRDMNTDDFTALSTLAAVLNSVVLPDMVSAALPGSSLSCGTDWSTGEYPTLMFVAQNVDPEDKDTVMEIAADALAKTTSIADNIKDSISAAARLSAALAAETTNLGVGICSTASVYWGTTGDPYLYYNMQNSMLNENNYDFDGIAEKYLNGRKGVITTTPQAGLLEENQTKLKSELAATKNTMSDDEINAVVASTKAYKEETLSGVSPKDQKYIDQINTVTIDALTTVPEQYPITDTVTDGVRYVTSEVSKPELGQGRIMFDVSDFSADELDYLKLYQLLLGSMDTDKHSYNDLIMYVSKYTSCSTDIMTLETDGGFTPYLIFKWQGFSQYSDEVYDIADELLFGTKFDSTDQLRYVISQLINSFEISYSQSAPYSLMLGRAYAMYDPAQAYYMRINGLEFLSFLRDTMSKLDTDPETIISSLEAIQSKLHNKSGAAALYAGDKESISANAAAAQKFFANIPTSEKAVCDFSSLLLPEANEAFEINSGVNYNGIFAPIDENTFNGKMYVLSALLQDAYFIPQLRNKHNVYSILSNFDDNGIGVVTYRDPGIQSTYDEYAGISEFLKNGDFAQETIDNYIKSIYSQYITPAGEVTDAYWYGDSYMKGEDIDYKKQILSEIKSFTADDIRSYADLFERWYNDGVKFTAASPDAIGAAGGLFNKKLDVVSSPDAITITINGQILITPTDPYISNDITMVPMRAIFEALGADVEWHGDEQRVTAYKDGITLELIIGSSAIAKIAEDGTATEITAESPSVIVDDSTIIPARAVSELLGCNVDWNGDTRTVSISY